MMRLALVVLLLVQPTIVADCATLLAAPANCASQCGDTDHSQVPQEKAPCCALAPEKADPQAVQTANVELRASESQAVMVVAHDAAALNLVPALRRTEASATDLRHKRPLTEVLCVLLV